MRLEGVELGLPRELDLTVVRALERWRASDGMRRLHARDATLWTGGDEPRWLDWLEAPWREKAHLPRLTELQAEVRDRGFTRAVVLGMGGSSLFPEVIASTFAAAPLHPALAVLDSTVPAEISGFEAGLDPARTLFIVSSKSGTTLETDLLEAFFHEFMVSRIGAAAAASRFIAVTDPGSPLSRRARAEGYIHTFLGAPGIGGRYAALSSFGTVPAAIAGVDVERLLERAGAMAHACGADAPPSNCSGVVLGIVLGEAARAGRDKVTLVASPLIEALGAWLEQLLAESTGKHGTGLIPVDREPLGAPEAYGSDRLFVYLRLDRGFDPAQDAAVDALEATGQPTVRIATADVYDLGREVFRWELATAVAGSILGVNPFDQPDVEASKAEALRLMEEYEQTGELPGEEPFFEGQGLTLFADPVNRGAIKEAAAWDRTLRGYLGAHLARLAPGDYAALLVWIARSDPHRRRLQEIRRTIRDRLRVATCLGFGPRYLHSTGQAYKGGRSTGVFLQITADDPEDLPVPGRAFTFGVVAQAQARADLAVLSGRGLRVLRVHLGADPGGGLDTLARAVQEALDA